MEVMASGAPHEHMPFGYAFGDAAELVDPNSHPTAGPPLLNDADSNALNNFFSNPEAAFGLGNGVEAGRDRESKTGFSDYDWGQLLSATTQSQSGGLFGLSTSGDQVPSTYHPTTMGMVSMASPTHMTTASEEILGAASTLFNSINSNQTGSAFNGSTDFAKDQNTAAPSSATHANSVPAFFARESSAFASPGAVQPGTAHSDSATDEVQHDPGKGRRYIYRFGSDGGFNYYGYVPPTQTTEQDITRRLLRDMNTMGRRESAPSTRAPSPDAGTKRRNSDSELKRNTDDVCASEDDHDDDEGSAKRRKYSTASLTTHGSMIQPGSARRKPSSVSRASIRTGSLDETARKLAKPQKENLTEEQKRNNHIMSEQKRRNCIKQGYDQLHLLVPELRSGGYSKSQALVEAAAFLEQLVTGNKELVALLDAAGLN